MAITAQKPKTLQVPKQIQRTLQIEKREAEEGSDTLTFSFSSEEPYQRWWGNEVLSHDPGSCDLSRLNNRSNLLWNHGRNLVLGVIERAWTGDDRRNYCEIRWSKSDEAQGFKREVDDGIISNVSCAYSIDDAREVGDNIVVTRWQPYEVSLVSVPADQSVGVGREAEIPDPQTCKSIVIGKTEGQRSMDDDLTQPQSPPTQSATPIDTSAERAHGARSERERQAKIRALCKRHGLEDFGETLCEGDSSIEQARVAVLDKLGEQRGRQEPIAQPLAQPLGLSEKDKKKYSLTRALAHLAGVRTASEAGFEIEVSDAIAKQVGKEAKGLFFPKLDLNVSRAYSVGNPSQGGVTTQTIIDENLFQFDLLNQTLANQLGVSFYGSLTDNVSFVREEAVPQIYWVGENEPVEDSEGDFDLINSEPHDAAGSVTVTRRMLQQSTLNSLPGGVEGYLQQRLREVCSIAIDYAIFNGTGSRFQPLGLTNMADIPVTEIGANGGLLERQHIIQMLAALMTRNASNGSIRAAANTMLAAQMQLSEVSVGTARWLWEAMPGQEVMMGMINGNVPAVMSNQLPGNLSKGTSVGNLGQLIMGRFDKLMLMEWGTVDLEVNRYGRVWKQGGAEVRIIQTVDVQVARPDYFQIVKDARVLPV